LLALAVAALVRSPPWWNGEKDHRRKTIVWGDERKENEAADELA
jgi:hypothetical protein